MRKTASAGLSGLVAAWRKVVVVAAAAAVKKIHARARSVWQELNERKTSFYCLSFFLCLLDLSLLQEFPYFFFFVSFSCVGFFPFLFWMSHATRRRGEES